MDTSRKLRASGHYTYNDTTNAHASAYVSSAAFDSLFCFVVNEAQRSFQAVFLYVSLIWVQR